MLLTNLQTNKRCQKHNLIGGCNKDIITVKQRKRTEIQEQTERKTLRQAKRYIQHI